MRSLSPDRLHTTFLFLRVANVHCHRLGPGPQPVRGMTGFAAQQQAQARNASLATARLPNGKIGALTDLKRRYIEARTLTRGDRQGAEPTGTSTFP